MDSFLVDRDDSREDAALRRRMDRDGSGGPSLDEKVFAGIAYLGPLFLFPLLLRADSPFCQFHARQGGLAFAAELIFILGMILPLVGGIFKFFAILLFLFVAIGGGVIVFQGKMTPLPLIGKYFEVGVPGTPESDDEIYAGSDPEPATATPADSPDLPVFSRESLSFPLFTRRDLEAAADPRSTYGATLAEIRSGAGATLTELATARHLSRETILDHLEKLAAAGLLTAADLAPLRQKPEVLATIGEVFAEDPHLTRAREIFWKKYGTPISFVDLRLARLTFWLLGQ